MTRNKIALTGAKLLGFKMEHSPYTLESERFPLLDVSTAPDIFVVDGRNSSSSGCMVS